MKRGKRAGDKRILSTKEQEVTINVKECLFSDAPSNATPNVMANECGSFDRIEPTRTRDKFNARNGTQESVKVGTDHPTSHTFTYENVLNSDRVMYKVTFRSLEYDVGNVEADLIFPMASVQEVNARFSNSLYGYFIGKCHGSLAHALIELDATYELKDMLVVTIPKSEGSAKGQETKGCLGSWFSSVKWKTNKGGNWVEAPIKKTLRKTGIWTGKEAESPKRNVVLSPETKVHYFDRDDMEFDDVGHAVEIMSLRSHLTPDKSTRTSCLKVQAQCKNSAPTLFLKHYLLSHSHAGAWSWGNPKARMTSGLSRGTPGDNIRSTPAGIIGSTSGGPLEVRVETPRTRPIPSASFDDEEDQTRVQTVVTGKEVGDADLKRPFKEAVKIPLTRRIIEFASPEFKMPANIKLYDGTTDPEDHLSRFSSAENSGEWTMPVWCRMFQQTLDGSARGWFENLSQGSIDGWAELRKQFTTRFSTRIAYFKDPTEITKIVRKANETLMAFKERWIVETGFITGVLKVMKISSFMDAHKCPELAKRYSDKVPKIVDEAMMRLDEFVRLEEAFANTELPKGEMLEGSRRLAGPVSRREDRFQRGGYGADRRRNEGRNTFNPRDGLVPYRALTPYQAPRDQGFHHPKFNLSSLTKLPKEILASEPQLNLQPPRPMQLPPKKENQDKYCDYHGEKGHYTNDCFQLRRQLEMALKSGKLNHLIKDVRQRGRRNVKGRDAGKDKVINMIRSWPNDRKRKSVKRDESWMKAPIVFPPLSMEDASDDPLIIEAVMEGYLVRRVYVDQGASVEVMFEHCFKNLSPPIRSRLRDTQIDLVGFARGVVKPLGKIELEVVFGDGGLFRTVMINFTIVRAPSPYNVIVERTGLRSLRAVSSTVHSMVKFLTPRGVATLVTYQNDNKGKEALERVDLTEQILVNPAYPDQLITIGGNLSEQCKSQLRALLKKSINVFAWELADMTGITRRFIEYTLNVNPSVEPVAQKRRVMASDRTQVISKEVEEWISAVIVRPVRYPTWISNPVLVKKGDRNWRMCIDFKNINSACPKDYYPLPDIDGKIESVVGFWYKCFLDAYKGYHQVQMTHDDEEKTVFYMDQGTYCYTKMPFGLKNAYVDDMVIKSNNEKVLVEDIAETFDNLRRINMKLNPKKCSFGVVEGKFMGYMVTSEGIQANPKKTKAIADMQSCQTLKEMKSLSGKLAALKRFLSRSAKKSLPFFETIKYVMKENKDEYRWTKNAERAFQEMKKVIVDLSLLTTPVKEETLYVYLAAATEAVSAVLLAERKGIQCPIHYVSRTLNEAERNYAPLEKLALSLLHMSRRLRREARQILSRIGGIQHCLRAKKCHEGTGMDKSEITRKQTKTSKHGHENQKSIKLKPEKSSLSQVQS
ncbi:reverse transcriptase domain-containing protein [Tanacetum coccineum]|uniref:Reverse transcriptase domain-containing protein n=1 Tax=Tanacetum coccineum TaxID=301880 RepID=A0ABQ5G764_9ASTR